jgi:nucleotide-binding universal stress UspA family protein
MTDHETRSTMSVTNDSIVIAYDGSENARHAIAVAARELGPRPAEVVHAWEPLASATSRLAIYAVAFGASAGEEVALEAERARAVADEGATIARDAGFDAKAITLRSDGPVAHAIVEYVGERAPRLVVMATRGLSGARSAIAGSVSHHVTQHVHTPVLTVPPDQAANDQRPAQETEAHAG